MNLKKWINKKKEVERQRVIDLRKRSFALEVQGGALYITCDGIACHRYDESVAKGVVEIFLRVQETSSDYDNLKPLRV